MFHEKLTDDPDPRFPDNLSPRRNFTYHRLVSAREEGTSDLILDENVGSLDLILAEDEGGDKVGSRRSVGKLSTRIVTRERRRNGRADSETGTFQGTARARGRRALLGDPPVVTVDRRKKGKTEKEEMREEEKEEERKGTFRWE